MPDPRQSDRRQPEQRSVDSAREDLRAAVGARRDLGRDYEDAVLDSFLERVDRSIAARVEAQVDERVGRAPATPHDPDPGARGFILAVVSLGTGIPITAIAGGVGDGVPGVLVAWTGIVMVNVAHALGRRRR